MFEPEGRPGDQPAGARAAKESVLKTRPTLWFLPAVFWRSLFVSGQCLGHINVSSVTAGI